MSLVTTEQMARQLGLTPTTLRALVHRNKIPCVRITDTIWRFDQAQVMRTIGAMPSPEEREARGAEEPITVSIKGIQ
jgi:excisionase family DNA binding protein